MVTSMETRDNPNPVQSHELECPDGTTHTFTGQLLACNDSRASHHTHPETRSAEPGERCSACRWFECEIYVTAEGAYVVHLLGETRVAGERRYITVSEVRSPHAVIEALTQHGSDGTAFIPRTSRLCLAEAVMYDAALEDAYVNRAVA
jgi:hypothetical protein